MANRAVDLVITYRIIKLLITPFNKQEAFKLGIIDEKGKVLRKFRTLKTTAEKKSYTILHRFVFNLKRILTKVGLGGRLGTFAVALATLLRENKNYGQHKALLESSIITYLKETNQYQTLLNEEGDIVEQEFEERPYNTCFGIDVYEKEGELYSEKDYAKKL